MTKEATFIFPHQLYKDHPAIKEGRIVYLIEETLFFNQYHFHQQKILLHRASMRAYADLLRTKKFTVEYVEGISELCDVRKLLTHLHDLQFRVVHMVEVVDNWLLKRITESCKKLNIQSVLYSSPGFLNTMEGVKTFFDAKKTYFQTDFYTWQRKQRNILLDSSGKPEGGQWSFDADNRLRYPKNTMAPIVTPAKENRYVREAKNYVAKNFDKHYGNMDKIIYPTDFESAEKWLDEFLQQRFSKFGIYEDAMVGKEHFLHHSVLTPMLNIGLLTPRQIVDKALDAAAAYSIPLNSLEGFIRQIIGWREFIRIVYEREGSKQRTKNYWSFTRKIPKSFWTGETGIAPVDNVIKKVLQTGYSHHIERLMVMGNFMLLCEFDPGEVYRWFMEMYVDAYDWVMVPNVYGMSQFADGGLMATKPYISGSNYLFKMSDYKDSPIRVDNSTTWSEIWDSLFWRFMHVHRDFFLKNPRLGMLVNSFDKWPAEKRIKYLETAENYLAGLDV